jgi:tetratricopeptide (TPR) repeat protein
MDGTMGLVARWQTERLRAAGIDAYWESNRGATGGPWGAGGTYEWLCSVHVAQAHLLPAMVLWKLNFRGAKGWARMDKTVRRRVAHRALLDAMLLKGGDWDPDFFTATGLNWLRAQLGLSGNAFEQLLGEVRRQYSGLGRRDLRWGLRLAAGCLFAGGLWWLLDGLAWQALVLILLGTIFGVHALADSLQRASRSGVAGFGHSHPPLTDIRARLKRNRQREDGAAGNGGQVAAPIIARHYLDLGICLENAQAFLNAGDAESALNTLENFAANDSRGIHAAYAEFYDTLAACQQSLGDHQHRRDTRIETMQLDWGAALTRGQQLLKAGQAKEAIDWFKRSIKANPGEYGTASAIATAEDGIKAAQALLKHGRQQ